MTTPMPPIVSRAEWEKARADLLVREKELIRLKDSVSAARRRLPMVEITEPYTFDAAAGSATLVDLFDGRRQLIVQHFMFGPDWERVFLRDGDRVFHTWQTFNRGEEPFMVVFDLLDLTPYGRQETGEDSPEGWPQRPPYEWMRLADSY